VSWQAWLVWGFASTIVLTMLMAGSQALGLTRMNIPHLLGTMFTANRDRALIYGVLLHVINGWAFAMAYVGIFHATRTFGWWFGALVGLVHGVFIVTVMLPAMPGMHPRMASELHGPTVVKQLEPPGFLGLNYGVRTPISVVIAHVVFGAMLGGLYSYSMAKQAPASAAAASAPCPSHCEAARR
jgi:hypothetical protein